MSFWRRLLGTKAESSLADEARRLGSVLADIFTAIEPKLVAGTATAEIDDAVSTEIKRRGVSSSFRELRFAGCCTISIDHEVINAPPSRRRLEDGQLVKLQIGIRGARTYAMQGWTYAIGECDSEGQRLMTSALEALRAGIAEVKSGARTGTIGAAIQRRVEADGFSVSRHFIGHGIAERPHTDPQLPGFGVEGAGRRLRTGVILSLNAIVQAGSPDSEVLDDNWTAVTKDRRRSAHAGQMVLVTDAGADVLTPERVAR